ncbi:MAG: hypothetical protein IPH07_38860 [Deltaproteobacteria bacterium]|nr:hypothetical protein [Deltaproteobacteria bacterium]MBK8236187.1 hypothetical protein [Deltaproteobacteria bacterium]MBK8713792.1 hypothetical protein [Deltaproteobacteria bacterium]MBP7290258.1 hypothetical protein [Nannocystaceae bacterium]
MLLRRCVMWMTALAITACVAPVPHVAATMDDGGSTGCGTRQCTDLLRVSLIASAGVFDGGSYALAWSVDGVDDGCGFVLSGDAASCGGDPPCVLDGDCPAEFGFTVPPHSVLVDIEPAPTQFSMTVLRDGEVIAESSFAPQYDTYFPNGADCEPSCRLGAASIDVP